MNANLSPPRRGFAVPPRGDGDANQIEFVPRLDMLALDTMEQARQSLGKKRQKLPAIMKSPKISVVPTKVKKYDQLDQPAEMGAGDSGYFQYDDPVDDDSVMGRRQRSSSRSKRVKFLRNDRGRIVATPLGPSKKELSALEMKRVWWTRNELKRCRERAQEACRRILNTEPEYRARLVRMLDLCGAERKIDYAEGIKRLNLVRSVERETMEDLCTAIVSGDGEVARGLEKRILNAMDVPFHRHRKSVQAVLLIQNYLEQQGRKHIRGERKAMLISSQYSATTKYALTWAREIAREDANATHSMFHI